VRGYKISKWLLCLCFSILTFVFFAHAAIDEVRSHVQEPKGASLRLIPFESHLIMFPFKLNYPESWYVREEVIGSQPAVLFTKEPVMQVYDRFNTGVGIYFFQDYLVLDLLQQIKSGRVISAEDQARAIEESWTKEKRKLSDSLKADGFTVVKEGETVVSGKPAIFVEYKNDKLHAVAYKIKGGVHLVSITLESTPENFEELRPTLREVIASFEFTR